MSSDTSASQSAASLPNIDYLGKCYDILKMDPTNLANTAQTANAIQITYTHNNHSEDGRYKLPDSTQYAPGSGGINDKTVQTLMSSSDYNNTFGASVTVKAGIPALASFNLSTSYKTSFQESGSQKTQTIYVYQQVYGDTINFTPPQDDPTPLTLNADFMGAVSNLPSTQDDSAYPAFVAQFGTHYASTVQFGGSVYQYTVITSESYSQMVSKNIDVKAGASGVFDVFSVGGNISTSDSNTQAYQNASASYTTLQDFVGGSGSSISTWQNTLADNPAPVRIDLTPLSDLLTPAYFPNDPDIAAKQSALAAYIAAYTNIPTPSNAAVLPDSAFWLQDSNGNYATLAVTDADTLIGAVSPGTGAPAVWQCFTTQNAPSEGGLTFYQLVYLYGYPNDGTNQTLGIIKSGDNYVCGLVNNAQPTITLISPFDNPVDPTVKTPISYGDQFFIHIDNNLMMQATTPGGTSVGVSYMDAVSSNTLQTLIWTIVPQDQS